MFSILTPGPQLLPEPLHQVHVLPSPLPEIRISSVVRPSWMTWNFASTFLDITIV